MYVPTIIYLVRTYFISRKIQFASFTHRQRAKTRVESCGPIYYLAVAYYKIPQLFYEIGGCPISAAPAGLLWPRPVHIRACTSMHARARCKIHVCVFARRFRHATARRASFPFLPTSFFSPILFSHGTLWGYPSWILMDGDSRTRGRIPADAGSAGKTDARGENCRLGWN